MDILLQIPQENTERVARAFRNNYNCYIKESEPETDEAFIKRMLAMVINEMVQQDIQREIEQQAKEQFESINIV